MGLLKQYEKNNYAYLKMGLYGSAKSGKTFTAADVAAGLYEFISGKKGVAMFDTEPGHQFIAHKFKDKDIPFYPYTDRSFSMLMEFCKEVKREGVEILIIDSVTHVWQELQKAALDKINKSRKFKISRLEFQHWAAIKAQWAEFTKFFLNAPLHIIICGRAGSIYEYQENEETGKKELITTGTKMSTEKEMGYEPSLLVEMFKKNNPNPKDKRKTANVAFIEGDRADKLTGLEFYFPTFETFLPHIEFLNIGGEHFKMNESSSQDRFDADGQDRYAIEKRNREIRLEEIEGLLVKYHPAQTKEDKSAKGNLMEQFFHTRSWTKISNMSLTELDAHYAAMKAYLESDKAEESETELIMPEDPAKEINNE